MKLLVFTDTHGQEGAMERFKDIIEQESPDLAVCAGDFTFFGTGIEEYLVGFDGLGLPVVLIHGNHEDGEEVARICEGLANVTFVHGRVEIVCGLKFFGFGGHGFSRIEPELEALLEEHEAAIDSGTIVISHPPPLGTALDEVEPGWHVGCESLNRLIKKCRPMLVLCGHIHECFHERDTLYGTMIINPGPDGEMIEVEND